MEPVVRQPLPHEALVRLTRTVRYAALVVSAGAWMLDIVVVLCFPAVWLVPGATGGTGRQWILGVAVTVLCVAVAVAHEHVLRAELTSAAYGFPVPAGPDAVRQQQGALALLAVVLGLPVWPQLVAVWTTNDGALVAPTALQLVVHTAPATILTVLTVATQWWVSRAIRAAHQAQPQADVAGDPVMPWVDAR